MTGDAIIATLILGAMCFAMWMLARLAKRRMGVGAGTISSGSLKVVGKRPLDQKSAIWVVEIAGGRHILLGSGADGTVTKLDDISADEYAVMIEDEPAGEGRKLRLARSTGERRAADSAPVSDSEDSETTEESTADQRFATVGESFQHFLGKAKDARKNRRASGE